MIASTILASALVSATPQAAPVVPAPAMTSMAPAAPSTVKPAMAEGKMDCCKDGCDCCGKKDTAKAESKDEHAH